MAAGAWETPAGASLAAATPGGAAGNTSVEWRARRADNLSPMVPNVMTSRRPRAALALLTLCAFAPPAHAAWDQAAAGSWVVVEAWKHGLGAQHVSRVTTTLLRRQDGVPWFEHMDESGTRWEDADPGTGPEWNPERDAGGRDLLVTTQTLHLDGAPVRCRVILNVKRTEPWDARHPVSHWLERSKRWEAVDTTLRVRVLKRLDLGIETHYRDGRIERRAGLVTQAVRSLHEPVRLHGRTYDCWVTETKTLTETGAFAGRTTVWGSDQSPTGWVRRIQETRDPRNGAMARLQEQLVDFRLR